MLFTKFIDKVLYQFKINKLMLVNLMYDEKDELVEGKEILGWLSEILENEIQILSKTIRTGRIKDRKKKKLELR